jgi:FMN phosphatase YigB (HAD superfamily)
VLTDGQVVFLFDVDNTLLDNDRFTADLTARLDHELGAAVRERYWALSTELRDQLGYADYLGTLQRLRAELDDDQPLLSISAFIVDYPFETLLYPRALDVVAQLGTLGLTVVLSDGDVVLQPRKIHRAGIWSAVGGRVLVTLHKERELDAMQRRYPASRYVMIGDKPALLAAMKAALDARLTTVFVRQGHYAEESFGKTIVPPPDHTVDWIGDLLTNDRLTWESS